MKNLFLALFVAFAFVACDNEKEVTEVSTENSTSTEEDTDMTASAEMDEQYVWWKGSKVLGAGEHTGKAMLSDVDLQTEDGKLVGGTVTVDLTSMSSEDLEGKKADDLLGHLASEDFFEIETYPTATFKITNVEHPAAGSDEMHQVTGDLTVKDVTKEITIPAKIDVDENGDVDFESAFTIDRSEYNVKYGSMTLGNVAKDKAIKDEVELKVVL